MSPKLVCKTTVHTGVKISVDANIYHPPTRLRKGNVFSHICPLFCPCRRGPCDHYLWCIGPHCTETPLPLLVISSGHHWRPVQACSLQVLTFGGYWLCTLHIRDRYASYWNAFLFLHIFSATLLATNTKFFKGRVLQTMWKVFIRHSAIERFYPQSGWTDKIGNDNGHEVIPHAIFLYSWVIIGACEQTYQIKKGQGSDKVLWVASFIENT